MLWIYRQYIFILSFNFYLHSSICIYYMYNCDFYMWYTYTYTYTYICIYAYIISVSQAYFCRISIYPSPVFVRIASHFPVRWRTPRNNRVVRRGCKDLSVQFRKGLLGFSLICHILQSGAAVFTASSLRNNNKYQQIIHSDTKMYVSCVYHVFQCIKLIWQGAVFARQAPKIENYPRKHTFGLGLNVPYICVSSIDCEKRHMLSVLITVSCRFRLRKKKLEKSPFGLWELHAFVGELEFILVELLGCPWYLVN